MVPDTSELDAESGAMVSAEVVTLQEGTEPLRGDFTLIFDGEETSALSHDASADEVILCVGGVLYFEIGRHDVRPSNTFQA